jgi:hypothetical protein
MGGSSSDSVTVGYKYYVGMHMALCHGPADKIVRIRVGGKKAWVGNNTGGALTIDKPGLFGGEKREGGVSGRVDIEMGAPDQGQNSYLASRLGDALLPAFRGVCCAVLRQVYVGLNPYLKDWGWLCQRIHTRQDGLAQWYDEKAQIGAYMVSDSWPPIYQEGEISLDSYSVYTPPNSLAGVFTNAGVGMMHDPTKQAAGTSRADWNGTITLNVGAIYFSFMLHKKVATQDAAVINFTDADGGIVATFYAFSGLHSGRPRFWSTYLAPVALELDTIYSVSIVQINETQISLDLNGIGYQLDAPIIVNGSIKDIRGYWVGLTSFASYANMSSVSYGQLTIYQYLADPGGSIFGGYSDMNPAHIIRECLTDSNWGMGYPESDMGDSFTSAADKLFTEQMGISILWSQQTSIEDFVEEILRHIDAALYVDRTTGKFELKLIRDDYTVASLLVLDQSNISSVGGYAKQTLAELSNEFTVSYNSNETGQAETVTLQNLAMIQQQGEVIPSSDEYMGFANQAIALKVASRDLLALSTPLVSATIYANREAAGLNIGDCFVWNWTEQDEDGAGVATSYVMRVTEMAFGDGVDNTVRIQCVQDVFSMPSITYVEAEPTEWTDPSAAPLPATLRLVTETPYFELVRQLGEVDAAAKLSSLPELGILMVAAGRQAAEINAELQVDSGAGYADGGSLDFCPCAVLDGAIGHLDTTATLKDGVDLDEFSAGSLAQIGNEIVVVESITDDVATIRRGCLDTVPAPHADGAAVIIWDGYTSSDKIEYVDSDELDVAILTATGQGPLAIADAPVDSVTMDQRAVRPYPPANVKIGDAYYPTMIVADDIVGIVATWVHRDRLQQTGGTVLGWTDASVGPEVGVTYSARLVRTDTEAELDSSTGISGATVTFTPSYRGEVRLEVWTVRSGLSSMQIFTHAFQYVGVGQVYYDAEEVYYDGEGVYYEL